MNFDVSTLYDSPDNVIRYTRDRFGLRGPYTDPSTIDILTVGGSTTDQMYINDGETWQDVIKSEFLSIGKAINIANAGVDRQTTYGHIKNFDWWFPYIPDLHSKYVLFYIGINDFHRDIHLNLFNKNVNYSYDNLLGKKKTLFDYIEENSALFHLWRVIKGSYQARVISQLSQRYIDFSKVDYTDKPLSGDYKKTMAPLLAAYERRLRMLGDKTKEFNAIPIFVTQVSRYYKISKGKVFGVDHPNKRGDFVYNGVDFYYMLQLMNEKTIEICKSIDGCIPIDFANNISFEDDDFYDFFHATPGGAKKVGQYLFTCLQDFF